MYSYVYYIIFFLLNPQFYLNIEQRNLYVNEFNHAMEVANYPLAIKIFERLESSYKAVDTQIRLDAAHAYFSLGDTSKAKINYEFSKDLSNKLQSSVSRNQLGLLALMHGDSAQAIDLFKTAIERNENLEEAKFNYELIEKQFKRNSPQSNIEQNNKQRVVTSDEKEDELEEYQSEDFSKEKALQLLDNLRENEKKGTLSQQKNKAKIEKDW